jgi:hypothetical protein
MKMTIKYVKPRNPFVAASLRRMAGAHRIGGGGSRLQAQRALRRELAQVSDRLRPGP